ncbi:MAG TPA: N-glycosylase [Holosporales bacterium]|nr:N-glycosylase [Holosporales bacterium]
MVTDAELIEQIENLKNGKTGEVIDERIRSFDLLHKKTDLDWFKELCFCILTANFTAKGGIKIQREINDGFLTLEKPELVSELKKLNHRFPNKRAEFIVEAREYKNKIKEIICSFPNEFEAREWMTKNIKGLKYKEASHFLRNVGYKNVAIIDRHVLNLLRKQEMINRVPKTLTRKTYLEIECSLKNIAKKLDLTLSELDLYIWFVETGKVLK